MPIINSDFCFTGLCAEIVRGRVVRPVVCQQQKRRAGACHRQRYLHLLENCPLPHRTTRTDCWPRGVLLSQGRTHRGTARAMTTVVVPSRNTPGYHQDSDQIRYCIKNWYHRGSQSNSALATSLHNSLLPRKRLIY